MGKKFSGASNNINKNRKNCDGSATMSSVKGSTKSPTKSQSRVLKYAQKVVTPQIIPPPPHIVEFEIDGLSERLGVFEELSVLNNSPGSGDMLLFTPHNVMNIQPLSAKSSKKAKGKRPRVKKSRDKNQRLTEQLHIHTPDSPMMQSSNPMSPAGDQSSHREASLPEAEFSILTDFHADEAPERPSSYIQHAERSAQQLADEVEYDLDEVDCEWLKIANEKRSNENLEEIDADTMEFLMDRFEKDAYLQMQSTGVHHSQLIDDDAECCVCLDGECQNSNVILFCDNCNLAVHQECYGVPYIPEGQWLCRRCLQTPGASNCGDCELCPNKGGAFKQTHDGKWAHVICAIWIPEVCFENTVFLEPIDGINNIPPARWRLTCFICKQKGIGACIQCHKSNCYKAFHVTCAQQAGLVMTIDTFHQNNSVVVKKTAWCDNHAPPGSERKRKDGDESSSSRQKLKETRKLLQEQREAVPTVSIPNISPERVAELAVHVKVSGNVAFINRLTAYWKLKRQSRNGVPLLRRLQITSVRSTANLKDQQKSPSIADTHEIEVPAAAETFSNYYRDWLKLRQDLEKVRLLSELVRKREQLKLAHIRAKERISDLTLRPFCLFLTSIVDEIIKRDTEEIFLEPVNTVEVSNYLSVISHPMDLGTMREKADSYGYSSINELEKDFNLMINNCTKFNDKHSIYYKEAITLREFGRTVISQGKRETESIGFDPKTGMHLPKPK